MIGTLLFLLLVPTTVVVLVRVLYLLVRGRRSQSWRLFTRLAVGFAVYMCLVLAVSVLAQRKVLAMGQKRCFDDWCLAVENATTASRIGSSQAQGKFYIVTVSVSSEARRVSQRAPDATVHLEDGRGRVYDPSTTGQSAYAAQNGSAKPLSDRLGPGESFTTTRVFDLPTDAEQVGLVVVHGAWPGWFIIGDSQSLLHKRPITLLNVQ